MTWPRVELSVSSTVAAPVTMMLSVSWPTLRLTSTRWREAGGDLEFVGLDGLEAGGLGFDAIAAEADVDEGEVAIGVGDSGEGDAGGDIFERHGDVGDHGVRLVADGTEDSTGVKLGERRNGQKKQQQKEV